MNRRGLCLHTRRILARKRHLTQVMTGFPDTRTTLPALVCDCEPYCQTRVLLLAGLLTQPHDPKALLLYLALTRDIPCTGGDALLEVQRKPVPTKECPPEWPSVCKWVVFSDLHVSPKTLDVCLEVLREVRNAARLRGAGVLFLGTSLAVNLDQELTRAHCHGLNRKVGMIRPALYVADWHAGDFWHVKGPLAVRPLNAVIAELQTWTQPTVMLVGNHDQVLLSGLDHALPPLAAACRSMIMIDQPCIFMDALWLPYRRNVDELQAALQQAGSVTAVFAHADVVGSRHRPPCLLLYLFDCTMLICKHLYLCSCWAGMRVHSPADIICIDPLHITWMRWL